MVHGVNRVLQEALSTMRNVDNASKQKMDLVLEKVSASKNF